MSELTIQEKLRSCGEGCQCYAVCSYECVCGAIWPEDYAYEAADRIDALEAENARLREQLSGGIPMPSCIGPFHEDRSAFGISWMSDEPGEEVSLEFEAGKISYTRFKDGKVVDMQEWDDPGFKHQQQEVARLREIVERLPKTADGVAFRSQMPVYFKDTDDHDDEAYVWIRGLVEFWTGEFVRVLVPAESMAEYTLCLGECYSTEQAAREAMGGDG